MAGLGSRQDGPAARARTAVAAGDLGRRRPRRRLPPRHRREIFVAELAAIGVTDVAFELFEGTHAAIEYRYPLSLAYLAERLS